MIKPFLHKTFSALLTLLVLLSTVSFTVEKHFCGDVLIDAAIFTEVNKCEKESIVKEQNATCCKDVTNVVEGQKELKFSSFEELEFQNQQFFASFVYCYANLFKILEKEIIPHKNYSSPKLVKDIQLLNDTFLI